ncbi:unnamed protein product [Merluccius merluccius]
MPAMRRRLSGGRMRRPFPGGAPHQPQSCGGFLALDLPGTPDGRAGGVLVVPLSRTRPTPPANRAQHAWLLLRPGGERLPAPAASRLPTGK